MIATSLLVIALTVVFLMEYDQRSRLEQIRSQGASLTRLLSELSFERLVAGPDRQGPLDLIRSTQSNSAFAYALVVRPENRPIAQVTVPEVVPPMVPLDPEPSAWFGERSLAAGPGAGGFREFYAPVVQAGNLLAHVRIGYREPVFALAYEELPFFAWVALPIFLIAPAFYYLMRREISPLGEASTRIQSLLEESESAGAELSASGDIGEFVRDLNQMIEAAHKRVRHLEREHTGILASSKILSYQKARLESVLSSLPEAIIVLDESGAVTYANQKLIPMIGIDHESIIGCEPEKWCEHPELLAFLSSFSRSTARQNASEFLEIVPPHNPSNQVAVSAYPLFSPRDRSEIYGTLIVFTDVTLETLAKQARKELVAQLSHELKTPLHVIGMYSEMLLEPEEDSKELRIEAGNVINDEVERVTALINNMLNLSRIEMGSVKLDRKRTRVSDLLKDAMETVSRRTSEHDLHFKLELPRELNPINVDKEMLRVAVNNLLTNAIKYNRPGGSVVLGAEETEEQVQIYVRDTGCGIAPSDQARIFDKFYRADTDEIANVRGHGLGLALAKDIVEMHLGELKVASVPGEGTEFTIVLKKTPVLLKEAV